MLALLEERSPSATIGPSEVARAEAASEWRPLMEDVRRAVRRLAALGQVEVRQQGARVDPSTARGAIRVGRGPAFPRSGGSSR